MYKSYGDKNFFDYGVLVEFVETDELEQNEFRIITCNPDDDEDNNYLIGNTFIDIRDTWINKEDVCKYSGLRNYSIDYTDEERLRLAIATIEYYGVENSGGKAKWMTKNEAIDYINCKIREVGYEYWKENFTDDNRNVVVEIYNQGFLNGEYIYHSVEDALNDFEKQCEKGWSIIIKDM